MIPDRTMDLLKKAITPEQFGELAYAHIPGNTADFVTAFQIAMDRAADQAAELVEQGCSGVICQREDIARRIRKTQ